MPETPKPEPLDINALHQYLWERSDRHDRIYFNQVQFGETLGVSDDKIYKAIRSLTRRGALSVHKRNPYGCLYDVTAPTPRTPKIQPTRRVATWG